MARRRRYEHDEDDYRPQRSRFGCAFLGCALVGGFVVVVAIISVVIVASRPVTPPVTPVKPYVPNPDTVVKIMPNPGAVVKINFSRLADHPYGFRNYVGKTVEIEARVLDVGEDKDGNVAMALTVNMDKLAFAAFFDRKMKKEIYAYQNGSRVTVRGAVLTDTSDARKSITIVKLHNCSLVK